MNTITRDYITGIFMFLLSLFYFVMTLNIPHAVIGNPSAPKIYPLILVVGGFVFSLTLLGKTHLYAKRKKKSIHSMSSDENSAHVGNQKQETREIYTLLRLSIITTVLVLGFAFVFERLGYILSTSLFLTGYMFLINGKKSWKLNIITSIAFAICSYIIFKMILSVPLPLFINFKV